MGRLTSGRSHKWLRKLFLSGLILLKTISFNLRKFCRFAVGQILFEITLVMLVIGLSYLFTAWGMPLNAALILAIALTITILAVAGLMWFKFNTRDKLKGELKIARLITQAIAQKTSREWDEYQDWLHDIMLYRQQLLNANQPQWQVSLITYWQLGKFAIVVVICKIKQVAANIRRSL
ncbi:MAG: hypothetical protein AAFW67_10465 [Cyanobacteria bacterium J06638_38]